jgi:hypothetical protein
MAGDETGYDDVVQVRLPTQESPAYARKYLIRRPSGSKAPSSPDGVARPPHPLWRRNGQRIGPSLLAREGDRVVVQLLYSLAELADALGVNARWSH